MRWLTYSCAKLVLITSFGVVSPLVADESDEAAIHEAAVAYVDAFNSKDAVAAASLFTAEARVESSAGEILEGAEAIQAAFEALFAADPASQISLEMESLEAPSKPLEYSEQAGELDPAEKSDGQSIFAIGYAAQVL